MRKIIESTFVTLDGVIDDPHVWGMPYWDEEHMGYGARSMESTDALLLGRETYQAFAEAWSQRSGDPYTDEMIAMPKYVASRTLSEAPARASDSSTGSSTPPTWDPGGSPPPRHWHPRQPEHFEVLAGELSVDLGGEPTRVLTVGDTLDVQAGTGHRLWNAGTTPARATWRITPPLRAEQMFREMAGSTGMKRIGWLWTYRNEFRLGNGSAH